VQGQKCFLPKHDFVSPTGARNKCPKVECLTSKHYVDFQSKHSCGAQEKLVLSKTQVSSQSVVCGQSFLCAVNSGPYLLMGRSRAAQGFSKGLSFLPITCVPFLYLRVEHDMAKVDDV
jgi:hypothetical protein